MGRRWKALLLVAVIVVIAIPGPALGAPPAPADERCAFESVVTYDDGRAPTTTCPTVVDGRTVSARSFHDCPGNKSCLWMDANYAGRRLDYGPFDVGACVTLSVYAVNTVSSFRNRQVLPPVRQRWFTAPYCAGSGMVPPGIVYPDEYRANLNNTGSNDALDSIKWSSLPA